MLDVPDDAVIAVAAQSTGSITGGLVAAGLIVVIILLFGALSNNIRTMGGVAREAIGGIARTLGTMITAAVVLIIVMIFVSGEGPGDAVSAPRTSTMAPAPPSGATPLPTQAPAPGERLPVPPEAGGG